MVRASIDLGTNTCLLLVVKGKPLSPRRQGVEDAGISEVLGDYTTIVRLGKGVDKTRELQPDSMNRSLACLRDYARRIREWGGEPAQAVCVATSQARDARNSALFFAEVEKETGFRFRVLSGEEEARLTFKGALLPGMDPKNFVVIDIGGGSTELITLNSGKSLNMGSVRFTERFFVGVQDTAAVSDAQFWACQTAIDEVIDEAALSAFFSGARRSSDLVAVAGTATMLAAWHLGLERFERGKVDGAILSRGDVHRMTEELKMRTVQERLALPCMEPERADVILAGALILWRMMEGLGFTECRVSTRGLRYGLLSETENSGSGSGLGWG